MPVLPGLRCRRLRLWQWLFRQQWMQSAHANVWQRYLNEHSNEGKYFWSIGLRTSMLQPLLRFKSTIFRWLEISSFQYNGNTDVPGTGTMTFVATCNTANTAWIYSGAEITKWECFERMFSWFSRIKLYHWKRLRLLTCIEWKIFSACQSCPIFPDANFGPPANLGTVVPSTDASGCAVRTYNCNVLPTQTAYITTVWFLTIF